MKTQTFQKFVRITITLAIALISITSYYPCDGTALNNLQTRSDFRYIIFRNDIDDSGRSKDTWRRMKVLLDAPSFSENNLKSLFYLLSKRFPTPDWLWVEVYTNLNQIPTPEEEDFGSISGKESDPEFDKYNRALFMRLQGNELIRHTVNLPNRELKTIILKGKDPFGR